MMKQNQNLGNFLSLKEGRDYNLVKKGSGRNTDYSGSCLSMKQSPVFTDPEKLKKLLGYLPSMEYSQLVEFVSADEMKKVLTEQLNGSTEEDSAQTIDTTLDNPALDPYSQPAESVAPQSAKEEAPADDIDALLNMI